MAAEADELLRELPVYVQQAREYALLGGYATSLSYFERAQSACARYLRHVADGGERARWAALKEDLAAEVKLVKELVKELAVFRRAPGGGGSSGGKEDEEEGGGGAWSPPPPRDRHAAAAAAAARPSLPPRKVLPVVGVGAAAGLGGGGGGRDVPAWEVRGAAPQGGGRAGGGGGGGGGGQKPNLLDDLNRRLQGKAGAAQGAAGGRAGGGAPAARVNIKAPLPPAALGRQQQQQQQQQVRGRSGGGGSAGGARPPAGSLADEGGEGGEGGGGGGAAPRPRYSDVQRAAGLGMDCDLIERLEREIVDLAPAVRWEDIAGLEDAKGVLQEAVVLPLMCPGFFSGIRKPWKGVLLYGPPGTGKTLLAKAVATECRTTFFNVSASSLASKWRGDGEKLVRLLFEMAQYYAPTVLFFDEVDSLASKRSEGEHEASRRMKTEMLTCMDGISSKAAAAEEAAASEAASAREAEGGGEEPSPAAAAAASAAAGARMVMVLGATNQPWELDDAFKRRFEKRIHIPLPGAPERVLLFRLCLRGIALAGDVALEALAARTEHYSGSDCAVVAKHAAYAPMRHKQAELAAAFPGSERMRERIAAIKAAEAEVKATPISMADLLEAVAANRPSASVEGLARFVEYAREHGAT